jgi:hypothetical protein
MTTATKRATASQLRKKIEALREIMESTEVEDLETFASWDEREREWQRYTAEEHADELSELTLSLIGSIRQWINEAEES